MIYQFLNRKNLREFLEILHEFDGMVNSFISYFFIFHKKFTLQLPDIEGCINFNKHKLYNIFWILCLNGTFSILLTSVNIYMTILHSQYKDTTAFLYFLFYINLQILIFLQLPFACGAVGKRMQILPRTFEWVVFIYKKAQIFSDTR
jgi:hypothetical protein